MPCCSYIYCEGVRVWAAGGCRRQFLGDGGEPPRRPSVRYLPVRRNHGLARPAQQLLASIGAIRG